MLRAIAEAQRLVDDFRETLKQIRRVRDSLGDCEQ